MNNVKNQAKEIIQMSKSLNKKNDEIYTDIACYIRVSAISDRDKNEILSDILEIFLRCQCEEKEIEDVIGKDYKKFCDSIIESVTPNKSLFNIIKEYICIIAECILILLTVEYIFKYIPRVIKSRSIVDYEINASFLVNLSIILLAIYIVIYIGKNSFKLTKTKGSKERNFIFGAATVIYIIILIAIDNRISKMNIINFKVNGYIILGIIFLYILYKVINNIYLKYKGER